MTLTISKLDISKLDISKLVWTCILFCIQCMSIDYKNCTVLYIYFYYFICGLEDGISRGVSRCATMNILSISHFNLQSEHLKKCNLINFCLSLGIHFLSDSEILIEIFVRGWVIISFIWCKQLSFVIFFIFSTKWRHKGNTQETYFQ